MQKFSISATVALALSASACGTSVPQLRDPPLNYDQAHNNAMVQAIISSIHCELQNAVTAAINDDLSTQGVNGFAYALFLKKWGAQVALSLTIDEKTTVSPNITYFPTKAFLVGGGLSHAADAVRIDKMNFYYTVDELYMGKSATCKKQSDPSEGSLLLQSDLKLTEWLEAQVDAVATGHLKAAGTVASPFKQNVLSHEVRFQLTTSGNITPAWTLSEAKINSSGSFFSTSRDRTHDLIVTFGPLDPSQKNSFLIPIAENAHNSAVEASSITTALQNAR